MFGWLKRRRIAELRARGLVLEPSALEGLSPAPACVVRVDLGWGPEFWAQLGPQRRFVPKERVLAEGRLIDGEPREVERVCTTLGLAIERMSVRF